MQTGIGYTITVPIREIDAQDVKDAFTHFYNYQDKVDLGFGVLEPNPITKEQFVASCCTQFMLNIYKNYMVEKAEQDAKVTAQLESEQRSADVALWFDNLRKESYVVDPYTNYPICIGGSFYQVYENEPLTLELIATDPNNLPLSFEVNPSSDFSFQLSGTALTITPNYNFMGFLSIGFRAFNGTKYSPTEYHSMEVLESSPTAQVIQTSVVKNNDVDIILLGSDPRNMPLTYSIVTAPVNGSYTLDNNVVSYSPYTDVVGDDTFTYKVSNGSSDSSEFSVMIAILEA